MTDKDTDGSPRVRAGRRNRRHSPWPLVIVVALPLLSAVLGLPIWVTLALLLVGAVLLAFSPHLVARHHRDPKKAWTQLMAAYTKLQFAYDAQKKAPADVAARERFSKLKDECLSLLSGRPDSDWGTDSGYVAKVRNEVAAMSASAPLKDASPAPAPSTETGQLVELRKQGVISDSELQAFSERFKALAAEKACGILETISGLHLQCRQGTMTEADYHAALRGLLDGLDRGDSGASPAPVAPA